ncbi:hypothetical protein H0H93_004193 [Arthromyces matolae]|nr:hypothetical protein H0H93_004193 [Arthromyces matolae]
MPIAQVAKNTEDTKVQTLLVVPIAELGSPTAIVDETFTVSSSVSMKKPSPTPSFWRVKLSVCCPSGPMATLALQAPLFSSMTLNEDTVPSLM